MNLTQRVDKARNIFLSEKGVLGKEHERPLSHAIAMAEWNQRYNLDPTDTIYEIRHRMHDGYFDSAAESVKKMANATYGIAENVFSGAYKMLFGQNPAIQRLEEVTAYAH